MTDGSDNRDRNDTGEYSETYSPADILAAMRDEAGLHSTLDIAQSVGCSRDTALRKLRRLEDEGAVSSEHIAGALVWTVTEALDDE